jgi:hypothetical protein
VAEQHLGVPVQCGRCARTFTTRAESADVSSVGRLDIAVRVAESRNDSNREHRFFVQHLAWSNSEQRHELAVLVVAGRLAITPISAALTPLLGSALSGTGGNAAGIPDAVAAALKAVNGAAVVAVVWDGRAYAGQFGDCRLHHHRGGQPLPSTREIDLAVGDWLVLSGGMGAAQTCLDASMARSAAEMARRLIERAGGKGAVVVAHCH